MMDNNLCTCLHVPVHTDSYGQHQYRLKVLDPSNMPTRYEHRTFYRPEFTSKTKFRDIPTHSADLPEKYTHLH